MTAGPGRPKGDGGNRRKIPMDKWKEIADLYTSGLGPSAIHKIVNEEWKIQVGVRAVCSLIEELRMMKEDALAEVLKNEQLSVLERYMKLQHQIEEVAAETKITDKELFLKAADRLIRMYEFQMTMQQKPQPLSHVANDHGREQLLNELSAKLNAAGSN